MAAYYPTGSTIRVIATFTDYAPAGTTGAPVSPTGVVVNIYDTNRTLLSGNLTPSNDGTGVYHYDWLLPTNEGTYYVEFTGSVGGETTLSRARVVSRFAPPA